jgi:hypothetical protein
MKTLLSILLFLIFNLTCLAQQENQTKMLEDAVRSLRVPNNIIYIDSALNYYGLVGNVSKMGRLEGYFDTTKVSLHLQKSEIRFLDKEFKKDSTFSWSANMFNNSLMMSLDSVNHYRLKFLKEQKDNRYFYFSRIIYFRSNSLAVFRLAEMYGHSAGYDYLFFYQKTANKWKRYMKLDMGAW